MTKYYHNISYTTNFSINFICNSPNVFMRELLI